MLIVWGPDFQLDDIAGVAVAPDLFGSVGIILAGIHMDVPAVLSGVALDHLAVLFQFVPVVGDDLGGRVVGVVVHHQQLYAKGLGRDGEASGVLAVLVLIVALEAGAGIGRQPGVPGIGIVAHVE